MAWDAWALTLLTIAEAGIFIVCLGGDIRNSCRYGNSGRGRHRRGRKKIGECREVNGSWTSTNGWKIAMSGSGSRR